MSSIIVLMTKKTKPRPHTKRSARRMDDAAALRDVKRGRSINEIALKQNIASSTVWRGLKAYNLDIKQLKTYRDSELSFNQLLRSMATDRSIKTLSSMNDDSIDALDALQKGKLVRELATVFGVYYDKERLERGLATANIDIHEMHTKVASILEDAATELAERKAISHETD